MSDLAKLAGTRASYTKPYTFIRGFYKLGTATVPYYYINQAVPDAVADLKLQRDVILDPRKPVNFQELFQRDVDMDRVRGDIVTYLSGAHHLRFFNALTVVMLPVSTAEGTVLDQFPSDPPQGAPEPIEGLLDVPVGPVQLQFVPGDEQLGKISWDRDAIKPVIVDGQHRFSAIRLAWEDQDFPWRAELQKTTLPLLLLVLDPRAGFVPGQGESVSVLQASRSIFIDLNKHAVQVSKSRQLLLDDRDMIAVAMRGLIDERVEGPELEQAVEARIAERHQLPLAVVDWQSNSAKFDSTMFVTTVLTLYELTELTFGQWELPAADTDRVSESLDGMIQRFRIDDSADGFGLKKELQACIDREIPFALSREQLISIAEAYRATRGRLVTTLLAKLLPYAELLSQYDDIGVINGTFEQWAALDSAGRRAFVEALGSDADDPSALVRKTWEGVKTAYPMAFQVVFQKAIVAALSESYGLRDAYAELTLESTLSDANETKFAESWIARFNSRIGSQLAVDYKTDESIFDGSVVSAARTISFTDASRKALTAAIVFALVAPIDGWASISDAEGWVKKAWGEIKRGNKSTETQRLLSQFGAAWKKSLVAYERAKRKAAGLDTSDKDKLERLALKTAAQQLFALKGAAPAPQGDTASADDES